jgi:hypothetical protein
MINIWIAITCLTKLGVATQVDWINTGCTSGFEMGEKSKFPCRDPDSSHVSFYFLECPSTPPVGIFSHFEVLRCGFISTLPFAGAAVKKFCMTFHKLLALMA